MRQTSLAAPPAQRSTGGLDFARAAVSRGPGTSRQRLLTEPPPATGLPQQRTMFAVDIESSTTRSDPVKAKLRTKLYELLDASLCSAGIYERHRDRFFDRGDGALTLIHPVEQAFKVPLLNRAIPTFNQLLTDYNASLPRLGRTERQLRIRGVVHAGDVHYDVNGCFGEALDIAFRLLDAPSVKKALQDTAGPLILVVSEDIYRSVVRHRYDGIDQGSFRRLVRVQIAGERYQGWVHSPDDATQAGMADIVEYRRPA
jgi:class 3 adenylate cyclase